MKKLYLLTKTLLVAAGLAVGASAWADITPYSESYSSTSTTDGWSTGTGGRFTPVILNEGDNYYLSVDQGQRNNNGATVTGTVLSGKAAAGDDFTITFDMKLSSSTNQTPVEFKIFDAANSEVFFSLTATGANVKTYTVNGTTTQITLPEGAGVAIASCTWCSYKITRSGTETYLTITNKATGAIIFSQAEVSGSSATGGLGNIQFVTKRYNANFAIDNIVVREVESGDVPSTYTAVFTDNTSGKDVSGTTTIYSDSERSVVVANGSLEDGETYYFTTTQANYYDYKGSFTVNGAKPEISFNMVSYPHYTINATAGSTTIATFASGYAAEGDSYRTYVPKAVKYNGSYYVLDDDDNANLNGYLASYTIGSTDEVKSINYTLDESIVFYSEFEDISTRVATYEYFADRSSKGYSKALYESNTMTTTMNTTKAGLYNVVLVGGNRDNSHTLTMNMKLKASDGTVSESNVISQYMTGGEWVGEMTANNVFVPAGSEFHIIGDGNTTNRFVIDYIIVRKVAEFSEIVGATDYTTGYGSVWNTTPIWINAGETGYYKFVNFNNTSSTNLYENWYLYGATEASENIVIFGPNHSNTAAKSIYNSKPTFTMADLNGATVELYTTLSAAADGTYTLVTTAITTKADGTKLSPNLVYTQTGLAASKLKLYISPEKNYLGLIESASPVAIPSDFAVSGTIASSGYSSLASGYGLDFSKATGLTAAYVVTKTTNDAVTLTSVDELPANSGVILKGTGGAAYSIPVKADAAYTGTNLLSAAVTATVVDDGAAYILKDGKFCLVEGAATEADRTIPAGKAYLLKSKVPSTARALSFMFGDEASGIDGVKSDVKSGDFYNMQGQRVASPRKGLYIVNGTKVIIK